MKNILKDLLYKLLLLLLAAVSGYEMYTYENGILGTVKDSSVILIVLAAFIFLIAASFIKNSLVLLILSALGGAFLLIRYDFGFLIALPLLLPCLHLAAVGEKQIDKTSFIIGTVLNAAVLICGIIKTVIALPFISLRDILHPNHSTLLSAACKGILLVFSVLVCFCLRKSFLFTAKKVSAKKKKNDTALSEKYNTFWLGTAAAALICAVYCLSSLATGNFCIAEVIIWLAVMLFIYFERDAVLHSFSAKDTNKTKRG